MKPDPYKQARSRKYLAKQRAKHGGKKSSTGLGGELPKIPRWIRNLPSNADRYLEDDAVDTIAAEQEGFDISSAEQLELILSDLKISKTPPLVQDSGNVDISLPCHTFQEQTSFDVEKWNRILTLQPLTITEKQSIPNWFCEYWDELIINTSNINQTGPSDSPRHGIDLSRLKSKNLANSSKIIDKSSQAQNAKGKETTSPRLKLEDWLDDTLS